MVARQRSSSPVPKAVDDVAWDRWRPVDRGTLLFVVRGDAILLIRKKRGLGAGKVNGPGGRFHDGETAIECALRETREEILVEPSGVQLCGELQFQFTDGYSIHVWVFRANDFEGTPTETEEADPFWVPLDEIPYDAMWPDDAIWLPLLLARRPFAGRFIFEQDEMLDYEMRSADADESASSAELP